MKRRVKWVDTAKGIGIILVLLGHAPRDIMRLEYSWIDFGYYFIYTFHMHFFFFLSGYLFIYSAKEQPGMGIFAFLRRKAKGLLVPWLLISLLVYSLIILVNKISLARVMLEGTFLEQMPLKEYWLESLSGDNPYCTHVWYMYTLFFVQILVFLLLKIYQRLTEREKEPLQFWIILEVISVVVYLFLPVGLPVLVSIKGYILYYLLGAICCRAGLEKMTRFSWWMVFGPIICIMNVIAVDMGRWNNALGQYAVSCLCVFFGAPIMILLMVCAARKIGEKSPLLTWLGKNSFMIYLFHQPFGCAVLGTVLVLLLPKKLVYYLLIMILCIIASVGIPIIVEKVSKKLGLGLLLRLLTGGRGERIE